MKQNTTVFDAYPDSKPHFQHLAAVAWETTEEVLVNTPFGREQVEYIKKYSTLEENKDYPYIYYSIILFDYYNILAYT